MIKYGGAAMTDPQLREEFARDVVLLKYVGMNPIVVHGGGPAITRYMERLGMEVEFVEGLRVSDEATVEVAKMVLVGKENKDIVAAPEPPRPAGGRPVRRRRPAVHRRASSSAGARDIGFVGEIERVDVDVLNHIAEDYIPVIASVGADARGPLLQRQRRRRRRARWPRRSARTRSSSSPTSPAGWPTRRPGVADLRRPPPADVRARLDGVDRRDAAEARGVRGRGRARACERAHIVDGREPHSLLLELFTTRASAPSSGPRRTLQALEREYVMGTYARNPVEFVRGEGTRLWDAEGNEYLDFLAGISVVQIGHCHPALVEAVTRAGRRG